MTNLKLDSPTSYTEPIRQIEIEGVVADAVSFYGNTESEVQLRRAEGGTGVSRPFSDETVKQLLGLIGLVEESSEPDEEEGR